MTRLKQYLGLERNILVMLGAIVAVGMGEELWSRFIPKYLELLGAGTWIIASYGTLKDLLDACYQYPGGWLADHLGRSKALVVFILLAIIGYGIYIFSESWSWVLAGTVFVMAWSSLSSPAVFAIIGDSLPRDQRSMGFGVQSIIKRIPIIIAPGLGGMLVVAFGFSYGLRVGLIITLALAIGAIVLVGKFYRENESPVRDRSGFKTIWREMDSHLKQLLLADCMVRWAEGIPKVFIVLYALDVLKISPVGFGWLTSLQMVASILVYIPVARVSDRLNRKPFVLLTFAFFALFPLALAQAVNPGLIALAFVIAGLREIGEPARKALIVDLASDSSRGRAVGAYYLVRGLAVFPASIVGGWLWSMDSQLPLYAAFGIGAAGCATYAFIGSDRRAAAA
jgi:MFS family permease